MYEERGKRSPVIPQKESPILIKHTHHNPYLTSHKGYIRFFNEYESPSFDLFSLLLQPASSIFLQTDSYFPLSSFALRVPFHLQHCFLRHMDRISLVRARDLPCLNTSLSFKTRSKQINDATDQHPELIFNF
jgi:hypothetical protein